MATDGRGASVVVVISGSVEFGVEVVVVASPDGVQPPTAMHTAAMAMARNLGGRGITAM